MTNSAGNQIRPCSLPGDNDNMSIDNDNVYTEIEACRACGHPGLEPVLSMGETPLADALLTESQLDSPEYIVPLTWAFCPKCALAQITETVKPEILFGRDYPYFSSVSKSLVQHFRESAEELLSSRKLNSKSMVVEAASNDGYSPFECSQS